jgi:hypothetical protein
MQGDDRHSHAEANRTSRQAIVLGATTVAGLSSRVMPSGAGHDAQAMIAPASWTLGPGQLHGMSLLKYANNGILQQ